MRVKDGRDAAPPAPALASGADDLTRFERNATDMIRWLNMDPGAKNFQSRYLKGFGKAWVRLCVHNLLHIEGIEKALRITPERGVLVCANHRTFFDSYIISCSLLQHPNWIDGLYFPVRSNFFYESWIGVTLNLLIGGGTMYPPIFRDPKKSTYNKAAIQWVVDRLQRRGALVGMHPEGTRGKGPDPYDLLPGQPGVGQVIVRSGATVVPVFINGLVNSFPEQVYLNYQRGQRRGEPIILVFGDPVDLSQFAGQNPRPALYKRVSDHVMTEIRKLGEREREVRADLLRTWRDR